MTQIQASAGRATGAKPRSNIYTVLVVSAFVALLFGIGAVWIQSSKLFGTSHPFKLVESATAG